MRAYRTQGGFTYLALLFFVAVMGAVLAATGAVWSTARQRDKERELLFIGNEFRKAIANYYERTPGPVKRYPKSLNDLLEDNRQVPVQRYLRRIYRDPITNKVEWGGVQAPDGGIMGVYSLSNGRPMKSGNFASSQKFEGAASYLDWKFVHAQPVSHNQSPPAVRPSQQAVQPSATPLSPGAG